MDYLNEYLQSLKTQQNLSSKTLLAYSSDIKHFFAYAISSNANLEIEDSIKEYILSLNSSNLKDTTIKRKIISLKRYYEFLYVNKYINSNPFNNMKFKYKCEKRLPKTLTKTEVYRLLCILKEGVEKATKPNEIFNSVRNLCLFDLLISTGIRIGEAVAISLEDISISEKTILINGKGRKQRILYISSKDTWETILLWLETRKRYKIETEKLFINRYHNDLSIHGVEYLFRKYRICSGINVKATPHYLRHTFATNLLSNGADLRSVQEILGHSSVSTTEIYTEITIEHKKNILEKYNFRNQL